MMFHSAEAREALTIQFSVSEIKWQRSKVAKLGTWAANSGSPFPVRSCRSSGANDGSVSARSNRFSVCWFMETPPDFWNSFGATEEETDCLFAF